MLSCIFYAYTFPCLLLLCAISLGPESFDSLKQWLFDISIRRSPTSTHHCEGEVGCSERVQRKVFSNRILLKAIFLVEWISNCVCLHTLAGRWNLAENTITMEICVGLLTCWQNLSESKQGRRPGREARNGMTGKKGGEGQISLYVSTF